MGTERTDYWADCLAESFEENGIKVSDAQLRAIADNVRVAHENYGQAFYTPPAGEHLQAEIKRLEKKLSDERSKIACGPCLGTGRIILTGPYHSSNSQCWKCGGEGKHLP